MLKRYKELSKGKVHASDGEIGHCDDLFFQEETWMIRYFVIDTGGWLGGRSVLLAPRAVRTAEAETFLETDLTREQIKNSPLVQTDQPISRAYEMDLHAYYGWPLYWGDGPILAPGTAGMPPPRLPAGGTLPGTDVSDGVALTAAPPADKGLRSARELVGNRISALDEDFGHVDDVVVDDELWFVRYLIVNTGSWLSGREVLLSCTWISRTSWAENRVFANLERDIIRSSPEIDLSRPLTRADEERLFRHYGQTAYW